MNLVYVQNFVRQGVSFKLLIGLALGLVLVGCEVEPPPDPNDPAQVGLLQPVVMQRQLKWASDAANMRVNRGEISPDEAKELVSKTARDMLARTPIETIPADAAWEYAEIFRTARLWKEAIPIFEKALANAPNEDRRINDSLRLAHCYAELGQVDKALQWARKTLNASPAESAPLLPAVYLEIVPAARQHGPKRDRELAQLLRDTVRVWERTVVDPNSVAGQNFQRAKPHHLAQSFRLITDLERRKP